MIARHESPSTSQWHRTAMTGVLIVTVSVWAVALCVRFLLETP